MTKWKQKLLVKQTDGYTVYVNLFLFKGKAYNIQIITQDYDLCILRSFAEKNLPCSWIVTKILYVSLILWTALIYCLKTLSLRYNPLTSLLFGSFRSLLINISCYLTTVFEYLTLPVPPSQYFFDHSKSTTCIFLIFKVIGLT